MTKYFIKTSLILSAVFLTASTALADTEECVRIPSCSDLGYKEVSCQNGIKLKCPFDDTKFMCVACDGLKDTCDPDIYPGVIKENRTNIPTEGQPDIAYCPDGSVGSRFVVLKCKSNNYIVAKDRKKCQKRAGDKPTTDPEGSTIGNPVAPPPPGRQLGDGSTIID